ncbi:MAG: phosphatidylglycerophosphatase A [Pseudomonadales bacterium]
MSASPAIGWRQWRDPEVWLVCGLGSGFSPKAPGTVGSLAAVALWWFAIAPLSLAQQLGVIVLATALGTWLVRRVQRRYGVTDPATIVVDEFAGQWIALLAVSVDLRDEFWPVLAAFGLFRLFDIWKPWPVGMLERRVGGAFGVMVDDLAAGVMALAVLQFTLYGLQNI